MKILLAKYSGFCFGVSRAVKIAEKAAVSCKNCRTLGPLIHNSTVVKKLAEMGVTEAGSLGDVASGDTVIIRSHGIGRDEYERLSALDVNIIDATCPDVMKIHETVKSESAEGRAVIIIGERDHPEITAIAAWCKECYVFEKPSEINEFLSANPAFGQKKLSVVSQTTGSHENFELCVNLLKKECTNFKIFDTICDVTLKRQTEAALIAAQCDAMVVIGGRHSANTRRLADICRKRCSRVYCIESADELDRGTLDGVGILGITAGASTPAWIIKEVYHKMSDEIMAAEIAANAEAPAEEKTESFEEMLERSIKTLYTGEKVTGIIAAITPTEISVDLGTKQSGYIPLAELTDDPNAKASDIVKVGDQIETYVMRVNDVEGTVMLSKKRLDSVKAWDDINGARGSRDVLEGVVVEENKGGVVVSVKGVRVFIPASQTGLPKDAPMSSLLKTKVRLRITEVNQPRHRVVGSIRVVAYEERKAKAEAVWNEIEVGKRYKGVVKSLTSYGAFVDIGGIDGMVHVSELSWSRIRQPSDVLKVGDELEVYIISFDKESRKISLGYKDRSENPWLKFTNKYAAGSIAEVKIVKLMPFGAFAEIIPGVDGLIHISQIADRRIGKPDEVLAVGQEVKVKITEIDNEKQKISLSIRALLEPEAPATVSGAAEEEDKIIYDTDAPITTEDVVPDAE